MWLMLLRYLGSPSLLQLLFPAPVPGNGGGVAGFRKPAVQGLGVGAPTVLGVG